MVKIDAVDKFLINQPNLKVIIPADYQFYFIDDTENEVPYSEKNNKICNQKIYKRSFNF